MIFLVYRSKVSHLPLLRYEACCQSWRGPWALRGHKVLMQISPQPGPSPWVCPESSFISLASYMRFP